MTAFNESFPLREVKVRSKYIKGEPWFTPALLTSSITKAKLLSLKLRKPTAENIKKYKDHNTIFNKLKRNMKTLYFKTALEENKRDSKKCWSILKHAIGKINDILILKIFTLTIPKYLTKFKYQMASISFSQI